MPRRGYRKGQTDTKQPRPALLRFRATAITDAALRAEAASRSMTMSRLAADIIDAHVRQTRIEIPHARTTNAAALRELCRIGNNLNQIAHEAHLARLHLLEAEARQCLAAVLATIERL